MQPDTGRAPVLAALCPVAAGPGPVEFGQAAGRLSGRPTVVVAVIAGAPAPDGPVSHLALERARRAGDIDLRVLEDDTPARGLARALDELAPAMIVLGTRPSPARLGSTARRMLHVAACPVAIVPPGYTPPPAGLRAVGAAFAAGPEARPAVRAAAGLAWAAGAPLRVVSVLDAGPSQAAAVAALRQAVAVLAPGVEADHDVRAGAPVDALVSASARLDLLVMGSRASGPPGAVRLGSVSRAVLERAACPVLLVPRRAPVRDDPDRLLPVG